MPSQAFNSDATWPWPAGVTQVTAECMGGAGKGGTASGNPATGGGGKGGAYARTVLTKGAESQLVLVVGVGAFTTTPASATTVTQGGTVRCRAPGGSNGADATVNSTNGAGGTTYVGGETILGDVGYNGGNGGTGNYTSGVQGSGAGGGSAGPTGAGGNANVNVAGVAGTGTFLDGVEYSSAGAAGVGNSTNGTPGPGSYGCGGSGGKANNNTDRTGGGGGQGVIVLTWVQPLNPNQAVVTVI